MKEFKCLKDDPQNKESSLHERVYFSKRDDLENQDDNISNLCLTQKSITQHLNTLKQTQNTMDFSYDEQAEFGNFFEEYPNESSLNQNQRDACENSTVISNLNNSRVSKGNLYKSDQKNLKQTLKMFGEQGIEEQANFNFSTNELLNSSTTNTDVQAPEVLQERLKMALSIFTKLEQSEARMEFQNI